MDMPAEQPRTALVVTSRQQLAERVAAWPGDGDVTWALVFVGAIPDAGQLLACREAAKLCDRVAALRLGEGRTVPPRFAETLREAGADLVWTPAAAASHVTVDAGVERVDGTLLLQSILAVLPLLVVVHRTELQLIRALRNIQGSFGDLFSLRILG